MKGTRQGIIVLCISLLSLEKAQAKSTRRAQKLAEAHRISEQISADPQRPVFELQIGQLMRGTMGAQLPILGRLRHPGFSLSAASFVELHNHNDIDRIPNQNWRGYVALLGQFIWKKRARRGSKQQLGLTIGLEHESDHETVTPFSQGLGFLSMNDVSAHGFWSATSPWGSLQFKLGMRQYLASNNRQTEACCQDAGNQFDGEINFARPLGPGGSQIFWSIFGSSLWGYGELANEHRLRVQAGWMAPPTDMGRWQIFARMHLGNDVGIFRLQRARKASLVLRWSL